MLAESKTSPILHKEHHTTVQSPPQEPRVSLAQQSNLGLERNASPALQPTSLDLSKGSPSGPRYGASRMHTHFVYGPLPAP